MNRRYRALAVVLLLDVVGAAGALLIATRTWQHLSAPRSGPFADVGADMTGRDVDSAVTALALVAFAGVVALLATRGVGRRIVGAVLALTGAAIVVRAIMAGGPVSNDRALSFILSRRQTASILPDVRIHVDVVTWWPVLTGVCGVLVLLAGLVVTVRGGRWQGMSARYENRPADEPVAQAPDGADDADSADNARATAAMWSALDRGEDPTSDPTNDPTNDPAGQPDAADPPKP